MTIVARKNQPLAPTLRLNPTPGINRPPSAYYQTNRYDRGPVKGCFSDNGFSVHAKGAQMREFDLQFQATCVWRCALGSVGRSRLNAASVEAGEIRSHRYPGCLFMKRRRTVPFNFMRRRPLIPNVALFAQFVCRALDIAHWIIVDRQSYTFTTGPGRLDVSTLRHDRRRGSGAGVTPVGLIPH